MERHGRLLGGALAVAGNLVSVRADLVLQAQHEILIERHGLHAREQRICQGAGARRGGGNRCGIACAPADDFVELFDCKQGEPSDSLYVIRIGFVKVSHSLPGGELVLSYLQRGNCFGEIGLLGGVLRTATCTALDHVEAVRIRPTDFGLALEVC